MKCERSLLVPSIIYAGSQAKEQPEIEMATEKWQERKREKEELEG